VSDYVGVGNRSPFLDSQTQRQNFARYKRKMRVLDVTEQKFGAGINENCSHEQQTLNVQRSTLNIQLALN
jgi:hypothetical protein